MYKLKNKTTTNINSWYQVQANKIYGIKVCNKNSYLVIFLTNFKRIKYN